VVAHLERALGKPVGEVVAARSIQSERLTRKLEQALDAIDPARVRADATSLARSESSVVVEVGPPHVTAGAVVLWAAGGVSLALAGVGLALRRDDLAVSGHRAHLHYLAKGGSLKRLLAEIYGRSTGCSRRTS
jgi:hypothetical protein